MFPIERQGQYRWSSKRRSVRTPVAASPWRPRPGSSRETLMIGLAYNQMTVSAEQIAPRQDSESRKNRAWGLPMFCRFCYYDLHGQQIPRCPECGTAFAFDDPDSFLRKTPGSLGRMLFWFRKRRRVLAIALTILLLCSYAVASSHLPSFPRSVKIGQYASMHLKCVMTTWFIQKNDRPQQKTFDVDDAKNDMSPSFSAWSETDAAHRKRWTTYLLVHAPMFVAPTVAYLLVVAALVGRPARREAVVLIVALSSVLFGSLSPSKTAGRLCPGSYAFLNDIVFLPDVDLGRTNPQRSRTIAAYDVQSFRRLGRRCIAFASGAVQWLPDDRARPLFQAQGIPYPEPSD